MFSAWAMVLTYMGYNLPTPMNAAYVPPENFVWTMHKQSGAPLDSGTTIQHTKNAMGRLLPDAPVYYGSVTQTEFIELLEDDAAIRITALCQNLPTSPINLKKWVGDYVGLHAWAIIGTKVEGGVRKVFWLDPMGRPSQYSGVWITWDSVKNILKKNANGEIIVSFGYKNTAVDPDYVAEPETPVEPDPEPPPDPDLEPEDPDEPEVIPEPEDPAVEDPGDTVGVVNQQRAYVAAGTVALHPDTLAYLFTFTSSTLVRVFGTTADGLYHGVVARHTGVDGSNPKVVLVPVDAVTGFFTQS
jgi:hypothetical protein